MTDTFRNALNELGNALVHITHIKPGEVEAPQRPHRVAALESGQSMEFGGDAKG